VGSDTAGIMTVGTGTILMCRIDFVTAFANAPSCVVSGNSTALNYAVTTTTTQLTVNTGTSMASNSLKYICVGL
jgi:hypothetical protein